MAAKPPFALCCCLLPLFVAQTSLADETPPTTSGSQPATSGGRPATGGDSKPAAATAVTEFTWFAIEPPKEWVPQAVRPNGVKKALYQLPPPSKELGAAEFSVTFFGREQGGGVEANLERWKGQFRKPEGMKDEEFAQVTKQTVDGMKITILEMRGDFFGNALPGVPDVPPQKDHAMFAATVETGGGTYYFKCVGPRATMDHWKKPWFAMTLGIKALKKP